MSRMTQFKDKSAIKSEARVQSVGLFNYPVLMAADISSTTQLCACRRRSNSALEFTRNIAERMNNRFGDLFTVPEECKEQHEFFGKDQG